MKASSQNRVAKLSKVVLLFGVACYFTSCVMDVGAGAVGVEETLPAEGGVVGPVTIDDAGTVLSVNVRQRIDDVGRTFARWSFITVSVLNENERYLTGFGGELWHEAGYDDGYWEDAKTRFATKLTIPEAGAYFFRFETQSDVAISELSDIHVNIESNLGSSLPFQVAGILGLLLGAGMWMMARARSVSTLEGH